MAEATAAPDVQIEDLEPTKKRLKITVSADTIDEKINDSLSTLSAETVLPGFRKGRAPRRLIERRFGEAVREETRNQIIADAYSSAIEENKIRAVGEPQPAEGVDMEKLQVEPGKSLEFAVDVEVIPAFELPELKGVKIKKPTLEIKDELIEQELERQRLRNGEPVDIKKDFKEGDRLMGRAEVTKKGEDEPFFDHDSAPVVVPSDDDGGKGPLLGLLIDDLAKTLKKQKVGDTFIVAAKGPEGHEREDVRGADIEIKFDIKSAQRIEPCTTEHLVELYGLGSEEVLTEQIKLALEIRRDQEIDEAMRSQVYEYLTDKIDFPVPDNLSEQQVERNLDRARMEMLYRGIAEDVVEQRLAEMRNDSADNAKIQLRLFFVLQQLAEDLEIQVHEHEVNGRIAEIAQQRGMRPEQLRQQLIESGRAQNIAMQVRDHKVADHIVADADVTEITPEEWAKIVEKRQGATSTASSKKKTTKKKSSGTKKKTTKKKTTKKSS